MPINGGGGGKGFRTGAIYQKGAKGGGKGETLRKGESTSLYIKEGKEIYSKKKKPFPLRKTARRGVLVRKDSYKKGV